MARRVKVAPGQRVTLPNGLVLSNENEVVVSDTDFTALGTQVTGGTIVDLGPAEIAQAYDGVTPSGHALLDHSGVAGMFSSANHAALDHTGLPGVGDASPFKTNTAGDAIIPVDNADSWIIGSDRMDRDAADATKDSRVFFNKVKGAFRSGRVTGAQWDSASVGNNSDAFGENTKASGIASHAEGRNTTASGAGSHAEGNTTTASGDFTHAEGQGSKATGGDSHAEGNFTEATGSSAHAQGSSTIASGMASDAIGVLSAAPRHAQHSQAGWQFATVGDAQICTASSSATTADATAKVLLFDGTRAGTPVLTGESTNVLTIPVSRAYQLKVSTVARRTDVQGEMAGWTWEGLVGRDSTGNARIIGTPLQAAWGDAPATDTWVLAVAINTVDATNNYVAVTATGQAAKTIRWVAKLEWVEVGG